MVSTNWQDNNGNYYKFSNLKSNLVKVKLKLKDYFKEKNMNNKEISW